MNVVHNILLGSVLVFSSSFVQSASCGPSWCQSTKLTSVERTICGDDALKAADTVMSHIYSQLMSFKGKEGHEGMWHREVFSNQQDWIKSRNKLSSKPKIMNAYINRTQRLYNLLQNRQDN